MSDVDETRQTLKRFMAGLVFIVAAPLAGCGVEDRTDEITALREMVAETQSLVPEYRARLAELRATTTSPMSEEL